MQKLAALLIFLAISPILLVSYILVKFSSSGPFVYKQKRVGKDFCIFTMYKIRTMVNGAENEKKKLLHLNEARGPVFKIHDDPRFTKVGKFLAHTGLNEILQLINVIKGNMAFVGPRPLPEDEARKIPRKYHGRFDVLPGITSIWVIRGLHEMTFSEWMETDLEYVKRKNIFLDLYIILKTCYFCASWTIRELF